MVSSPNKPVASRQNHRGRKLHECTECGLRLARPSHLARHIDSSHLHPGERSQLPCPICGKTFSRNDVLLRHLRCTHKLDSSPKRNLPKSCSRCVTKKLKCDRVQPCHSCSKAGSSCDYTAGRSPSNSGAVNAQHGEKEPCYRNDVRDPERGNPAASPAPTAAQQMGPTMKPVQSSPENMDVETGRLFLLQDVESSVDMSASTMPSWPSPDLSNVDGSMSLTDFGDSAFSHESTTQYMRDVGDLDWRNINLDWLDFGLSGGTDFQPDDVCCSQVGTQIPPRIPLPSFAKDSASLLLRADISVISKAPQTQHGQQWPFEQTRDSAPQTYHLPPLQDVLKGALQPSVPSNMAETLVQLMSKPYLPKLEEVQDHTMIPVIQLLRRSVDNFLVEFNPILPMIHAPSFSLETCPTVLVAAMACIGALFSNESDALTQSTILSDICLQTIAWLGGSDSTNYQDLAYLSASCLHQIYSLGSGNRQLYQNADRSRGMLMGSLRGMGLLGSQLNIGSQKYDRRDATSTDPASLHTDWLHWRDQEQEIRVAWSSFEYDCSLCTLTNRRGAVDLSELPGMLPCSEVLWDAPSAQAWKALQSHLPCSMINPPFPDVLRQNVAGKRVPAELSPWSKRLCAQVLGRSLWDLKQLQILSMSDFLGLPSLLTAQQQAKGALLTGLTTLGESMSNPTSIAELINYNITGLICHYSHLCTAEDIMDLVIFMARNTPGPRSKKAEIELGFARRRLESTLADDLQQTRNLVWHAAQIISIANEYVVSAPCEILRTFMGYTFIIAVATHCPQVSTAYGPGALVRLDSSETPKTQITAWIQYGGAASIGTSGDFCTRQGIKAVSQQAQALLQKMRFWGLAERFTKILANLGDTDL